MWVGRTEGVTFVALAVAAAGGCSSNNPAEPYLDVWAGVGVETMALYEGPDGFWWQDPDVWSSNAVGVITISGDYLSARGGICEHSHYGPCTAMFSPPVVQVSVPQFDAPALVFHLERVDGALEVRDDVDAILASLKPRPSGADIFDRDGNFITRADWDVEEPRKLWVKTPTNALLGWTVGAVPPEIGALALGDRFGAPYHAVVIGAALTWLR